MLATTAVPAAIASTSTMPKLSPAGVGRAVDVGAAQRGGLLGVVDLPEEAQMPGQVAGLLAQVVLVAAAHDEDLDVGKALHQCG